MQQGDGKHAGQHEDDIRLTDLHQCVGNWVTGVAAIVVGLAVGVAGVTGWRRGADATRWLLLIVAMIALAQVALLAFSYIAVFTSQEVEHASSAWRYVSHLGPLMLLTAGQVVAWQRPKLPARVLSARAGLPLALAAAIFLQALFAARWRIDCTYPHVRPGYDALASLLAGVPANATVTILSAADGSLMQLVARHAWTVATRDWQPRRIGVAASPAAIGESAYVVDLTGADPARSSSGQNDLRATLHRASPATVPLRVATTSCPSAAR